MAIILVPSLNSHSGRTDRRGGHHNRISGGYHYHNGGAYVNITNNYNTKTNDENSQPCKWILIVLTILLCFPIVLISVLYPVTMILSLLGIQLNLDFVDKIFAIYGLLFLSIILGIDYVVKFIKKIFSMI